MEKEYDVLGIGNILVDYVAEIDDALLEKLRLKKGVSHSKSIVDIKDLESKLENIQKYVGGTVPNVTHGIANLCLKSALAGSVAKDENGEFFINKQRQMGIKESIQYKEGSTGVTLSLTTPDGERTFVVDYGVAEDYTKEDIDQEILARSKYLHFTGYEFESMNKTIKKAVKLSKKYKTKISFDLGDPEVVLRNKKKLKKFLKKVDIVFANEEEAENLTNESNPKKALEKLAKDCEIGVVKLGKEGCLVKSGKLSYKVKGYEALLTNTIGAGDGFAAGFLYGLCKNHEFVYSCVLGNFYASRIVQETGAILSYKIRDLELLAGLKRRKYVIC